MAFIRKRGKKYSVVYKVRDEDGTIHQKSESFGSHIQYQRTRDNGL